MRVAFWPILLALAALMEVGGDAVIQKGLRDRAAGLVSVGFAIVGTYGLVVNLVRWDFSRLMGVYVAFFACAGALFGRFVFQEKILVSTWLGLALIVLGGLIIQIGQE